MIKSLCFMHYQKNDEIYATVTSLKVLLYFFQRPDMINDKYPKESKARVESMNDYNACFLRKFPWLIKTKMEKKFGKSVADAIENEIMEYQEVVKKEVMAAMFLHG